MCVLQPELPSCLPPMSSELLSATNFLVHILRLSTSRPSVSPDESLLERFGSSLMEVLRRRYRGHWFPEKPSKGSGFRCIRVNGRMDPVLAQAAEMCRIKDLTSTFPFDLTLWIDPREVSYRIGENGSICVLYESPDGSPAEAWTASSLSSGPTPPPSPKTATMTTNNIPTDSSSCGKENLRKMDYLLDPRSKIESLAAFVSS